MRKMKNTKIFSFALFFVVISSFALILQASGDYEPSTYTVSGTVYAGGNTVPGAIVQAYQHNRSNLLATATADANGNYTFSGMSGTIDVLAFPNDKELGDYVPTWYVSADDQSSATGISVTSNLSGINVSLISK